MDKYIEDFKFYLQSEKEASENTVVSYLRDTAKFLDYIISIGLKDITECSEAEIHAYMNYLDKQELSKATISRSIASLKAFFAFINSNNSSTNDPLANIKVKKSRKNSNKILTNEEIDLLLSQPEHDTIKGIRDRAMLELIYATGIHVSELVGLNINNINTSLAFVRCEKTSGERIIPLHQMAVRAVEKYIYNVRPLIVKNKEEKALFVNLNGTRMSRQGFWKLIKQYQESSGILTEITPSILRHSFAVHLLENGASLSYVKEMLGHSDMASTIAYAKHIKTDLRHAYVASHPRAK